MKKVVCSIIVIATIIIGCKKTSKDEVIGIKPSSSTTSPDQNSLLTSKSDDHIDSIVMFYTVVADQHNRAVDYLYKRIKLKVDSAGTNPLRQIDCYDLKGFFVQFMVDSLSASGVDFSHVGADSILSTPGASSASISDEFYRISGDTLNPGLRNALSQLELLIADSLNNKTKSYYDTLIKRYVYPSAYNNFDAASLNDNEKGFFTASAYVGMRSIQYWQDNHAKWDSLVFHIKNGTGRAYSHSTTGREWYEDLLKEMAKADMGGTVIGGIRAFAACAGAGTVVLPGLGTVAGAAICGLISTLGSGVISSAGAGILGAIWHYLGL